MRYCPRFFCRRFLCRGWNALQQAQHTRHKSSVIPLNCAKINDCVHTCDTQQHSHDHQAATEAVHRPFRPTKPNTKNSRSTGELQEKSREESGCRSNFEQNASANETKCDRQPPKIADSMTLRTYYTQQKSMCILKINDYKISAGESQFKKRTSCGEKFCAHLWFAAADFGSVRCQNCCTMFLLYFRAMKSAAYNFAEFAISTITKSRENGTTTTPVHCLRIFCCHFQRHRRFLSQTQSWSPEFFVCSRKPLY